MEKWESIEKKTLCWNCRRSCQEKCSWAENGTPVDGWTATPTIRDGGLSGYAVEKCPLFDPRPLDRDPKALDSDGCVRLLEKMMQLVKADYIYTKAERERIEKWLMSETTGLLCHISDPAVIIHELKRRAAAYDEKRRGRYRHEEESV